MSALATKHHRYATVQLVDRADGKVRGEASNGFRVVAITRGFPPNAATDAIARAVELANALGYEVTR